MRKVILTALLTAAVAAMILPGGVAISSYSGAYQRIFTLTAPYDDSSSNQTHQCVPLEKCIESSDGDAATGRMTASSSIQTPFAGAGPVVGPTNSTAFVQLTAIDDLTNVDAGSIAYRFYVHFNRVSMSTNAEVAALGPEPLAEVDITAGGNTDRYFVAAQESGTIVLTSQSYGQPRGPNPLTVTLISYTHTTTVAQGAAKSSVDLTLTKIERVF